MIRLIPLRANQRLVSSLLFSKSYSSAAPAVHANTSVPDIHGNRATGGHAHFDSNQHYPWLGNFLLLNIYFSYYLKF